MSEEKSMDELFLGKEYSDKQKAFDNDLHEIEKRHLDYFKAREASLPSEEHDRLHNHTIQTLQNGRVWFGFLPDSDLDQSIQKECMVAFHKWFGNNT